MELRLPVALDDDVPETLPVTVALLEWDAVALALAEFVPVGDTVADGVRSDARLRPRSVRRSTARSPARSSTASRMPLA